ncbi:ankyrin repeat and MYND domain-containing protein 2-like [Oppia nitens]|uniref:ankyrin repeat and MYND domain-containing protein 2-like n=1 Tax=Oppia nitens TaxID=1686743 RepID=UPI0023DC843E|nr:ankyrin repeat and MYND domain-containing protein 2-like [Oppia nitens]
MMTELSENEKQLIQKVSENKLEEVKQLLNESDVRINCCDDNGMNLLQHAAYKGNHEICRYFIERGADVNHCQHIHGYTALMFAALGGHLSVVSLLLESEANINAVNSVNRNAAQMAAFVGQHAAVAIINNFISRDDIEYYTKIQGLEKEPRLSLRLVSPLHTWVRQTNIHPIKVGLHLKDNWILIENGDKIIKVLELLCEKQLRQKQNEMISLKVHYLVFILRHLLKQLNINIKCKDNDEDNAEERVTKKKLMNKLDAFLKSWLKAREGDGFPLYLEQLLRQSIREYPYQESALFQQLIRTLSTVDIGSEPSAISILSQAVNGQKGFDEDSIVCGTCGEPNPDKRCSQCKRVAYCNIECQKFHWNSHKKFCKSPE